MIIPPTPDAVFEGSHGLGSLELSIVVPAYNEAQSVRHTIARLCEVASRIVKSYEVIVVDDGSLDETFEIVKSMARANTSIIPLRFPANVGKGSAVKLASQVVRGEAVVVIDADMEIDPGQIGEYIDVLKHYDICIASKRHPNSSYEAPFLRKFLSVAFNKAIIVMTGTRLSDSQTGLKAMRLEHFRRILSAISVKRYAYDVEILTVAQLLSLRIAEFPVKIVQTSAFSKKAMMYMLIDLLGIAYRVRVLHWYRKNLANPGAVYTPIIPI